MTIINRFENRFNYGPDGNPIPGEEANDTWYPLNSQTPLNFAECTDLSCYECVHQLKNKSKTESTRRVCPDRRKYLGGV